MRLSPSKPLESVYLALFSSSAISLLHLFISHHPSSLCFIPAFTTVLREHLSSRVIPGVIACPSISCLIISTYILVDHLLVATTSLAFSALLHINVAYFQLGFDISRCDVVSVQLDVFFISAGPTLATDADYDDCGCDYDYEADDDADN